MPWVFSLYFELKISPFLLVVKIPTLTITQPPNPTFFGILQMRQAYRGPWKICEFGFVFNPSWTFPIWAMMLRKLHRLLTTKDVALRWQSVHTGIAIICNRLMRSHRDGKGRPEWYDSLVNYSGSGGKPQLLIKDLGMDLEYSSVMMVGFCGMIFKHEVKSWGSGDSLLCSFYERICEEKIGRTSCWMGETANIPLVWWFFI